MNNDPSSNLPREGLELLLEAANALLRESDVDNLLVKLLDKALKVGGAERGYILMRDAGGNLVPTVARSIEPGETPDGDPSSSVIAAALNVRHDDTTGPKGGVQPAIGLVSCDCKIGGKVKDGMSGDHDLFTAGLNRHGSGMLAPMQTVIRVGDIGNHDTLETEVGI